MKKINISKKIFLFIIVLAFFLRFWQLAKIPPSLDWDEVAIGYNAWSLKTTGKDEYGLAWPLVFRSFDDYKPPLYFYLTIPSEIIFGISDFAVRFPSAFFGFLAVIASYFLIKELFQQQEEKNQFRKKLALLTCFLFAISPWHLYFCRIGFEANVGLALNVFGAWAFFKGLKKPWFLLLSSLFFCLSVWVYHSERVFVPLLLVGFFLIWKHQLFQFKKQLILSIIIGLIFFLPLIKIMLEPANMMRMKGVNSLSDQTVLYERSSKKLLRDQEKNNQLGLILDNRRFVLIKKLIEGYLSPFNLGWLFLSGDNPRHKAPDMGLLYLWELPFMLIGIYSLAKTKGKASQTIFWWFLVAPVAASPTTELPHAVRTLVFLPTFQIFTAKGILAIFNWWRQQIPTLKFIILFPFLVLVSFNLFYFFHQYFVHLPYEFSDSWQYGRQQAVEFTESVKAQYQKIIVSTKLEQPHMFWLFYSHYPPAKYLQEGGTSSGGFAEYKNKFDKYEFRPINWEKDQHLSNVLLVGLPEEFPSGLPAITTINYLNGQPAIMIVSK